MVVFLYKMTTIPPGSSLKSKANLKTSLRQHHRMRQHTTNVILQQTQLYIFRHLLRRGVEFSKNEMPTVELFSYTYKYKFRFYQLMLSSGSSQKAPEDHSFSLTLTKYILSQSLSVTFYPYELTLTGKKVQNISTRNVKWNMNQHSSTLMMVIKLVTTYWLFQEMHWNRLGLKLFDDDVTSFNATYLVHCFSFQAVSTSFSILQHSERLWRWRWGTNSISQHQIANKLWTG